MTVDPALLAELAVQLKGDKGDRGDSGDPGGVLLDAFVGDDDAKLDAAMAFAASQTYPPIIKLTNRSHQFATKGRKPYRGLAIAGPGGAHWSAADAGATAGRASEIALTFDSSVDGVGWFHHVDTANQAQECSFENLVIRDTSAFDGSHPSFLTQSAGALGYQLLHIRNLTTSGLWSVLGTLAQKLLLTASQVDGVWHVNNGWSTDFHIGGSDNNLWTNGGLLSSPAANHPAGAGIYHLVCATLSKSTVGPLYITNIGKWGGVQAKGPAYNSSQSAQGGPVTIYGLRCEGHNAGDPAFGNLIRVEGGIVRLTDSWVAYGMSNPAGAQRSPVDAGAVHVSGGALVASGLTYDRATSVAETVPMIVATGAAVVRVRDVLVGARGGKWVGTPRVRKAISSAGSVTVDDSVTLI